MRVASRFVAFGIHLGISFLLFVVLAAVIKCVWFPGLLFEADGGWDGIKLIIGVDLVIGPLLTLFVYNINKPELKRDLSIIGCLQVLCLAGGMLVVENARPIAIIYGNSTFYTASRQRYEDIKVDIKTIPMLRETKPVWISIRMPADKAEKGIVMAQAKMLGGLDMSTDLYQPYADGLSALRVEGASTSEADKMGLEIPEEWTNNDKIRVFNLRTRDLKGNVAVDISNGEILGLLSKKKAAPK